MLFRKTKRMERKNKKNRADAQLYAARQPCFFYQDYLQRYAVLEDCNLAV